MHKLKQRLNFAYKKAKEIFQKQANKYKTSYDKKVKGPQLQIDDLVLVKRVAWKGRHKIQNKWETSEYVVVEQPNVSVPVYKVKSIEDGKVRTLHRNMLLPLGIKFIPEEESDDEHMEEPEFVQSQSERQESEKKSQPDISVNMTPVVQSDLEHGKENIASKTEHVDTPEVHVEHIDMQQGSMAPLSAISSDQLIDSHLSLDPDLLVPIDDSVGSEPTKTTQLSSKYNESLDLPFIKDNSDSLMKTEEFLEFVDDLSQESSPLSEREGTLECETIPSVKAKEYLHSSVVDKTPESVDVLHVKAQIFL